MSKIGPPRAPARSPHPEHVPDGDPCSCGVAAYYHRDRRRPEHEPVGDPCAECGRDASDHRKRRHRRDHRRGRSGPSGRRAPANAAPFVGLDGEGEGSSPHRYTYLAAVDEHGVLRGDLCARRLGASHLSTERCLDFLCDLGVGRVHAFSAGYDLAKILEDLPDDVIYRLNRPDERQRTVERNGKTRVVHDPVHWRGFRLNYLKRRFTVQRGRRDPVTRQFVATSKSVVLWDVFGFFQGAFTSALGDWRIASKQELDAIGEMKAKRGRAWCEDCGAVHRDEAGVELAHARPDCAGAWKRWGEDWRAEQAYCRSECEQTGRLVRSLCDAHEVKGLTLTQFYGAGSTAGALMKLLEVKQYLAPPPREMVHALSVAFVGGRFEFDHVGPVPGPVWTWDISSAYPYQLWKLPCLTHGKWTHLRAGSRKFEERVRRARLALIRCEVRSTRHEAWGVLPWRSKNGTIVWPLRNPGVWTWRDEADAAGELADVRRTEAWVYETDCDCRPFGRLPELYAERVRIGKEGPGIVLKLGMNSIYGKTAQSQGRPPFQSWVWAGSITSGTRAMLLRAVARAVRAGVDPWDVLGFATDAVFARAPIPMEEPEGTGTARLDGPDGEACACGAEAWSSLKCKRHVQKPLGGWEEKRHDRGVFLMRPGVYFPLEPTREDLEHKLVKARGMSGRVLLDNAGRILDSWRRHGPGEKVLIEGLVRFVGMKTGVQKHGRGTPVRDPNYGRWVPYPVDASLEAQPKRWAVLPAREGPEGPRRLAAWGDGRPGRSPTVAGESWPYRRAVLSAEAREMREAKDLAYEQPLGDFELA